MENIVIEHKLLEQIGDLQVVIMKALQFSVYEEIFASCGDDQDKLTERVIMATTGLTELQVNELTTPDFNTLENASIEQTNRSSEYFFDLLGQDFDVKSPLLFDPLEDAIRITYTIPKVKVYKVMKSIENTEKCPYAQARYITEACTSLDQNQIDRLSVRDWNMLQGQINNFLQQDAGYLAKSQ